MDMKRKLREFFTLKRHANDGFTLVELIVVIAIVAILGGVAVPAYSGYIEKADAAADAQLLADVNKAFAAACIANGSDIYLENAAYVGLDDDKKVILDSVEPYGDDFAAFFEGSEDSAFKAFPSIYFDSTLHMFKEGTQAYTDAFNAIMNDPETAGKITAIQASKFAEIGAAALLEQVHGVSGIAAAMISAGQGKMYEAVMNQGYIDSLAVKMGITSEQLMQKMSDMAAYDEANGTNTFSQFMANSTVLNVAGTMNDPTKFDETATKNMLANASWGGLGTTLNDQPETGLAQAALLYGMYTAFDPEGAKSLDSTDDLILLSQNKQFKEYLADINKEGSAAQKDYEGYKAALNLVNDASSNADVTNQILNKGYNDGELSALLQQAMNQEVNN